MTLRTDSNDLDTLLSTKFGWSGFRPLQKELIEHVMAGESALGVLPTGGGKSLCYQLPALLLPGITLVISPLISLMKDQVDALVARGIAAVSVNSQDTPYEMQRKLADIEAGLVRLVYVAPERLKSGRFLETCQKAQISLLAVDEAHCVSQWGHDFRPDYRFIKDFRAAVGEPPLLALTATATRRVQTDVLAHLGIQDAPRYIADVDRPNLWLGLERCISVAEKKGKLLSLVERAKGSVVVYVTSRKDAEEFAAFLEDALGEPVAAYHAGMSAEARTSVQNRFMADLIRVVTATNAFGMGIDKPDIRAVIHAGVPESIEAYFQEIGRAGRDGAPAECTMVVIPGRAVKLRQFILEKDEPEKRQVNAFLQRVSQLAESGEGVIPFGEADAALGTLILSYLQGLDQVELLQRTSQGMRVQVNRRLTPVIEEEVWVQVQQHVKAKRERFRFMRNFVYLETCRRRFLMQYFGEEIAGRDEACCSTCHPRPVVARRVKPAKRAEKRQVPPPIQANPNPELLEQLKLWRRTQALDRDVPAYVIFGDNDLQGIAAVAPRTLDELAACRGVGPTKLKLYGSEVLAVVGEMFKKQQETATLAAPLFAEGKTLAEVAESLQQGEDVVWQSFLTWIVGTTEEIWKKQVRRVLTPDAYRAIRKQLRGRLQEPFAHVLGELQQQFDFREITLTRAVMQRVGER